MAVLDHDDRGSIGSNPGRYLRLAHSAVENSMSFKKHVRLAAVAVTSVGAVAGVGSLMSHGGVTAAALLTSSGTKSHERP